MPLQMPNTGFFCPQNRWRALSCFRSRAGAGVLYLVPGTDRFVLKETAAVSESLQSGIAEGQKEFWESQLQAGRDSIKDL